jgi:DNA topoisomerase I
MAKNLVIVESPAKAKTIERFLGSGFVVKSSFGHVRDLSKKGLGVDVESGFEPQYEVADDKQKVIQELKKLAKEAELVWLASDEDREGEAIAWHLAETLNLKPENTRRIVFHEITKPAIDKAIQNPRSIDQHLVKAQQARRVLDRLVGFELSPLLWKKVKPALSAGRVQSVAVRLIVDRETEIRNFETASAFRVTGLFLDKDHADPTNIKAEYQKRFSQEEEATKFLTCCNGASFKVDAVEKKPAKRSPAPPFTTSTLQQEAARKLGFSVAKTMMVAQQLYESGQITYMRTDSLNLSDLAITKAKGVIENLYGENYIKTRKYKTKSKGAQEAHEAIRPTYLDKQEAAGDASQKRLYELIWKRTIASQMSDAQIEKTQINILGTCSDTPFIARGEVIVFDGFLKVYIESVDDEQENSVESKLPAVKNGQALQYNSIVAEQRYTQHPPRYSEASLVKKMEELGIGRPSTYSPTISTIQKREYVLKTDKPGQTRTAVEVVLEAGDIVRTEKKEKYGQEKGKLFPTDLGTLVNRFLEQYFSDIIDYRFTADVEKVFDDIAEGKEPWNKMISTFHQSFHKKIIETNETAQRFRGEKLLGEDPATGKKVFVKIGRYGPMAQIGDTDTDEEVKFAGLLKGQSIDEISLDEALEIFKFPKEIGEFEGKPMHVAVGRFGPYVKHNNKFFSLTKLDDPQTITEARGIELIEAKRAKDLANIIKTFDEKPGLIVMNGRFGPYISYEKKNYKIPRTTKPEELTIADCEKLIDAAPATKTKGAASKTKAKGAAAKKRSAAPKATKSAAKTKSAKK